MLGLLPTYLLYVYEYVKNAEENYHIVDSLHLSLNVINLIETGM